MQTDIKEQKENAQSYDWASYYEAAFHAIREQNIQTTLQIEKEQESVQTLSNALQFICGNKFWTTMAPIRTVCDKIDAIRHPAPLAATSEMQENYQKEAFALKHRYLTWIQNVEKKRLAIYENVQVDVTILDAYVEVILAPGMVNPMAKRVWAKFLSENPDTVAVYGDEDFFIFSDKLHALETSLGATSSEKELLPMPDDRAVSPRHTNRETSSAYVGHNNILRMHPWLKPCWSPETLMAFQYFGNYFLIRKDYVEKYMPLHQFEMLVVQAVTDETAYMAVYELLLHLFVDKAPVRHVEEVLFHQEFTDYTLGELQLVTANRNWDCLQRVERVLEQRLEAGRYMRGCSGTAKAIKEAFLQKNNINAHLENAMEPDCYHVVYDTEEPLVSVVILSKDHPDVLELCLESLVHRTDYENLELIVVDNGSTEENKNKVEQLKIKYKFDYLHYPMEFNFSKQCNMGVEKTTGELILLLNDDIEVIEKSWLRRMVGQALQEGVGAVGARLLYAGTNKIQHVGITNLAVGPSHKLIANPDDVNYYHGRNRVTYNMLGVTAACLLVERRKYLEICGLDEQMKVAYNDVDFCFKLYEKGYRNVLRNDAVLYHYESLSRGLDAMNEEKWARLLQEKAYLYDHHPALRGVDPYYHSFLADDSSEYRIGYKFDAENKQLFASLTKIDASCLASDTIDEIHFQVDHADYMLHEGDETPDYYWVSGWTYIHGDDQCKYGKRLLFKNAKNEIWEGMYFIEYRKDVEAMLFAEKNVGMAGFSIRIVKGTLEPGGYELGILYEDGISGKKYVAWSERKLEVI